MDIDIKKFCQTPFKNKLIRIGLIKNIFNKNSKKLNLLDLK
jgi:hypothetical protein